MNSLVIKKEYSVIIGMLVTIIMGYALLLKEVSNLLPSWLTRLGEVSGLS